jgi:hypothetical protein
MGGAVFERALQLQHHLAGAVTLEPFVGDRRAGDIAAQVLQFLALIGAPAQKISAGCLVTDGGYRGTVVSPGVSKPTEGVVVDFENIDSHQRF